MSKEYDILTNITQQKDGKYLAEFKGRRSAIITGYKWTHGGSIMLVRPSGIPFVVRVAQEFYKRVDRD